MHRPSDDAFRRAEGAKPDLTHIARKRGPVERVNQRVHSHGSSAACRFEVRPHPYPGRPLGTASGGAESWVLRFHT